MDSDLIIILPFVLIVALILSVTVNSIVEKSLLFHERKAEREREATQSNPSGSAKKVERLEQRLRVLERLATDRGQDLALQIENLREPARADFAATYEDSRV